MDELYQNTDLSTGIFLVELIFLAGYFKEKTGHKIALQ